MRAPRVVGTRRADAVARGPHRVLLPSVPQVTSVCNGACRNPTSCAGAPGRTRLGTCGAGRLVAVQACGTAARGGPTRAATGADRLPLCRVVWTRSVCPIAAAHSSRRCAWVWSPTHASRSASSRGRPPSMTMIATRSVQDSRWCGGIARAAPPGAAAGPASTASTPVAQASLTSLHPPYAPAGSTATRFPRSAAWRASWRHCCCPAVSASRAKTSTRPQLK